ncbi:lasso peptide biosynthesis protein [Rhodospirillum rubrum]|uniref:lasso peptide biosynthesis protein n=1 Tax=Rhodospirillum rubrum TaxID=1085 RepID=UPI00130546D9
MLGKPERERRGAPRRHGHKAQVPFGVTGDEDGPMTAHAWTRCQGKGITGGQGIARYRPIPFFVTEARPHQYPRHPNRRSQTGSLPPMQ